MILCKEIQLQCVLSPSLLVLCRTSQCTFCYTMTSIHRFKTAPGFNLVIIRQQNIFLQKSCRTKTVYRKIIIYKFHLKQYKTRSKPGGFCLSFYQCFWTEVDCNYTDLIWLQTNKLVYYFKVCIIMKTMMSSV